MVHLDRDVIELIESDLSEEEMRALGSVLDADLIARVEHVHDSRGVQLLIIGDHPVQRDSNSLTLPWERFDSENPEGYYWIKLTDERNPDVKSVEYDEVLNSLMNKYHVKKREQTRPDSKDVKW